jgi:hypothetical protein
MTAALDLADSPEVLFVELMEEISHFILNQPRNVQSRIGPSGIGEPCSRELIANLMELPSAEDESKPNWRAYVGTCMHDGLQGIFEQSFQQSIDGRDPRFLTEKRVTVGRIGDWDLTGSCDLFDTWSGTVWDWKTKSATQHTKARRHGLTPLYRVQFHCYGLGMHNLGYEVKRVGGIFLLRDGELADSFQVSEPFDPTIAYAALGRANQLYALAQLVGAETAMSLYPPCTEEFCRRCGNYKPYVPPSREPQNNVRDLVAAANRKA